MKKAFIAVVMIFLLFSCNIKMTDNNFSRYGQNPNISLKLWDFHDELRQVGGVLAKINRMNEHEVRAIAHAVHLNTIFNYEVGNLMNLEYVEKKYLGEYLNGTYDNFRGVYEQYFLNHTEFNDLVLKYSKNTSFKKLLKKHMDLTLEMMELVNQQYLTVARYNNIELKEFK